MAQNYKKISFTRIIPQFFYSKHGHCTAGTINREHEETRRGRQWRQGTHLAIDNGKRREIVRQPRAGGLGIALLEGP